MTSSETFPVVDYLRGTASNLESLIEGDPEDAPDITVDAVESSEVVAGLRAAADQVEKLQQQLAASDQVALGTRQACAMAQHALHALIGETGLKLLMPVFMEAEERGQMVLNRLDEVLPAVRALIPALGWEPFSSDTVESAQAWAAGRLYRRANGPLPEAPEGRALAPAEFQDNQDWRVEWERGWIYEDQKLARTT